MGLLSIDKKSALLPFHFYLNSVLITFLTYQFLIYDFKQICRFPIKIDKEWLKNHRNSGVFLPFFYKCLIILDYLKTVAKFS